VWVGVAGEWGEGGGGGGGEGVREWGRPRERKETVCTLGVIFVSFRERGGEREREKERERERQCALLCSLFLIQTKRRTHIDLFRN